MNSYFSTDIKDVTLELSKKIAAGKHKDPDWMSLFQELKKFERKENDEFSPGDSREFGEQTERTGIWRLNKETGEYNREKQLTNVWHLWSDTDSIKSKKESGSKRIILLGESVARGYFYDPYYTPATVLKTMLNACCRHCGIEVIDLARTGLGINMLRILLRSPLVQSADAIVVFAGNNFLLSVIDALSAEQAEAVLRKFRAEELEGVMEEINDYLRNEVISLMEQLKKIYRQHNIEIVFIIPEYNLLDWQTNVHQIPNVRKVKRKEWNELKEKALQAFEEKNWGLATGIFAQLQELDKTHPMGYEFLARIMLEQGLYDEARRYFEKARDVCVISRYVVKPRILSVTRTTILEQANGAEGVSIVDSPAIFKEYLNGRIADKRMFMDHCHLSAEGIQVTMAHTAQILCRQLFGQTVGASELLALASGTGPAGEVVGKAHAFAAIHNAHYGQPYPLVKYHATRSIEAYPQIAEFMTYYIDMVTRKTDTILCKSFEKLLMNCGMEHYPYAKSFTYNEQEKILDIKLISAFLESMRTNGINQEEEVNQLRQQEHGVRFQKINLLENYYASDSLEQALKKEIGYYQSQHIQSSFFLIAEPHLPVRLNVCYRIPRISSQEEKITVSVNGYMVKQLPVTDTWQTAGIELEDRKLKDGVNVITIDWPIIEADHTREDTSENKTYFDVIVDKISPIVGEIHTFTAVVPGDAC